MRIIAGIVVILVGGVALGATPATFSRAVLFSDHAEEARFCTSDGLVFVVHSGEQGSDGYFEIGHTLLTGPSTFWVGPGFHAIQKGCYYHAIANSTVIGTAKAYSTVWYHP
jgi:hypothetical protein